LDEQYVLLHTLLIVHLHFVISGVILQFVAALLGTVLLGVIVHKSDKTIQIHHDKDGIFWSCMAGLSVGFAEMLSFFVSGLGVPATQSIPIITGGSVLFGAILGILILNEQLMMRGWSGVALLVTGIVLTAIDPGEKVQEGGVAGVEVLMKVAKPPSYWIVDALVCANAYAFYNIFIKKGSAR
jgi:transporter family protein